MTLRISAPERTQRDGFDELTARVHCAALPEGAPDRLSYAVEPRHGLELTNRADPFLVGAVPLAMKLEQALVIEGPVSMRLAHGMVAYQDILSTWFPNTFRKVDVAYDELQERSGEPRPRGVGCCFSGGIDSFSAIQDLRPPRTRLRPFQLTHAVMVNGFDQVNDLDRTGPAERLRTLYSQALNAWDVKLVMIHANLKLFRDAVFERRELPCSFGSPLTACAHALAPVFGRFNLSGHATYRFEDLKPMGSHPALDHHLSSDQLQVIHLGAHLSRSEKLERLVAEKPVRETLRVCFGDPEFDPLTGAVVNCGECEKCIRTKAMLDILGWLTRYPTFAKGPPIDAYRNPQVLAHIPDMFLKDLLGLAERRNAGRWIGPLRQALQLRR